MVRDVSRLSIVCPAYEEEEVLPHFHRELARVLDALEGEYAVEILYVDDGSRDDTLTVLRRLAHADPRVRYLSLSRNFGHQAALTAGLDQATGDVVIASAVRGEAGELLQAPAELLEQARRALSGLRFYEGELLAARAVAATSAEKRALASTGFKITLIRDLTPIPHNGCRPPKRRRV